MDKLIHLQELFMKTNKEYFYDKILFSPQWWFLIFMTIVIWTIWVKTVDTNRLKAILLVGCFTGFSATILDEIGLSFVLWFYPYRIVYFTSRFTPVNMALLPVTYMMFYQYFRKWKSYFIALFVFGLFAAFIAEPLFVKAGIYKTIHWKHWYSTPIYILIGIFVKWLVDFIDRKYS
jgi:hypothetical protein